jgi:hypothetical protein
MHFLEKKPDLKRFTRNTKVSPKLHDKDVTKMMEKNMTNKELYHSFLKEPMKGAVINITKWRFRVWFQNDEKVWINKAERFSHKQLKLGDVESFRVDYIKDKDRYILNIIGKNNSLLPYEKRQKSDTVRKNKRILIRDISAGEHSVEILYMDDKRTSMKMGDREIKIGTPLLFKTNPPPLNQKITISIMHKMHIEAGEERAVSGKIEEWSIG